MHKALLIVTLLLVPVSAWAAAPAIGDNTIFVCSEQSDAFGCYGEIAWLRNPISNAEKGGVFLKLARSRRLAKRFTRQARRLKKRANRQGETELAAAYEAIRLNAKASRLTLRDCWNYEADSCDDNGGGGGEGGGGEGGGGSNELAAACEVAADPANGGARTRSGVVARIVNGAICSSAPNSPAILIRNNGSQYCTGSLIRSNVVLTAAHCVQNQGSCTSFTVHTPGGASQNVTNCIGHPDWGSGSTTDNDIALLFLDSDLSANVVNIYGTNDFQTGETVVAAGYGRNEDDDENLRATWNTLSGVSTNELSTFYQQSDENEGTTCNGDSGGPLYIYRTDGWYLVGVTSNGTATDCALPGTNPAEDTSNWANVTAPSNFSFIEDNT